jgi:hypothetical protein
MQIRFVFICNNIVYCTNKNVCIKKINLLFIKIELYFMDYFMSFSNFIYIYLFISIFLQVVLFNFVKNF